MTTTTMPAAAQGAPGLDDLTIAKLACEGKSLMIDTRGIGSELLGGYSPGYAREVMSDPAAPKPVQVANNGAFLFVRLEAALFILRRERVTAQARRERTKAATAKRLGAYAKPGGGRRLQLPRPAKTGKAAASSRKNATTATTA